MRALEWRYGDGLAWRLVTIGLREDTSSLVSSGTTPESRVNGWRWFADTFGMPLLTTPRARLVASGRMCRAVKAAGLQGAAQERGMLRGVRMAWFTSLLLLDEDEAFAEIASGVPGLDPERLVRDLTAGAVEDAYEADRAEARSAAGIGDPAIAQDRAALFDGGARFTAPSLVFRHDGQTLVAGGFQSFEAYDVCVANLAPAPSAAPASGAGRAPRRVPGRPDDGGGRAGLPRPERPARHRRHQGGAREPGRVGRDPAQRDRRCLEPLAARCLTGSSWCGTARRPGTPRAGSRRRTDVELSPDGRGEAEAAATGARRHRDRTGDVLAASPGARDGRGDRRGGPRAAGRDHRRAPARDRRRPVRGPDRRRDRGRAVGRGSSTDGDPRPTPSFRTAPRPTSRLSPAHGRSSATSATCRGRRSRPPTARWRACS